MDTNFFFAFGFVDSRMRLKLQPKDSEINQNFSFEVLARSRVTDDEDADPIDTPIGFHKCTEADLVHFGEFMSLKAQRIREVFFFLNCLDDPSQIKF